MLQIPKLPEKPQTNSVAVIQKHTEEKRKNFFGMFIGTNRTGKSATARLYAEAWRKANPTGEIVAFDPQGKFRDIATRFIFAFNKDWDNQLLDLRNCLLIMDDYRLIQQKNIAAQGLIKLLNFRAQWNVDMIFVTHSPALVINNLSYYITHYYIFKTQTQKDSFERKIPNYAICLQASELINDYVRLYTRGSYPNFPHIIVDNEYDTLTLQGISKEKFQTVFRAYEQNKINGKRKR